MKKFITLLLALAMILSLTACGEQPTGAAGDDGRHTAGLRRRPSRRHRGPEEGCGRGGNRYLDWVGH